MLRGRYPALLDANVLHPAFVRSALFWFAAERLFRPHWSDDIVREWEGSVRERFPDVPDKWFTDQLALWNEHFPDARIAGYEPFIDALDLPDPEDRHVLAAAIVGRCAGIVTCNVKHFPRELIAPLGIEISHPDEFIVSVIDLDPERAFKACRLHREAMARTSPTREEYLERFERAGLIQAHQRLTPHVEVL